MSYPFKISARSEWFPFLLIVLSILIGFYFYAHFPNTVPIHWSANGTANGFGSKFQGAFIGPLILIGLYLIFLILPLFDPRRDRYQEFAAAFLIIRDAIMTLLAGVFLMAGFAGLGYNVNIKTVVPLLIGVLFMLMGNYMGKIRNNWFVGIRNPWTLSSENVWNKTHRLGGFLFTIFGLLVVLSSLTPKLTYGVLIGGLAIIVVGTTLYSYFEYQAEKK